MNLLLHLLKYKLKSLLAGNVDLSLMTILKNLAAGTIYFLFAFGTYKVTFASLYFLLHDIHLDVFLFHSFLSILLFMFFLSVNAGNILVSVSGLYRGKEVNYLLTKPIPFEKIFLVKFLENFFSSSGSLFVILFAVFYAYARYFSLSPLFFFFATFGLFLPFTLIAGLLGVILLFGLVTVAQKIGVKTTIFIITLFYLLLLIIFFSTNDPTAIILQAVQNKNYAMGVFQHLDSAATKLLPNYWVTSSLYWYVTGNYTYAFGYSLLLILTASVIFMFSYVLARKLYYKTYVMSTELQKRKTRKFSFRLPGTVSFGSYRTKFYASETLIRKELALFLRDPVQVLHLLFMLFLMLIFLFGLRERPNDLFHSLNPSTQTVIYLALLLFNLFLITSLCLRFVFPHLSMEGEPYWKLRSAPINLQSFFRLRFCVYFLFLLLLGEALNYFSHKRFSNELLYFGFTITFLVTWTVAAINYSLGCYYVNYREKNAIRLASSQGASAAFLLCLLYLGIVIALIFPPVFEYFHLTQNLKQYPHFSYFLPGLLKILPLSLIIIIFSYRLTMRENAGDLKNLI